MENSPEKTICDILVCGCDEQLIQASAVTLPAVKMQIYNL